MYTIYCIEIVLNKNISSIMILVFVYIYIYICIYIYIYIYLNIPIYIYIYRIYTILQTLLQITIMKLNPHFRKLLLICVQ